jgi:integrase
MNTDLLISFSPKELEKMARREYQDPPLKRTAGANPRWYVRVRKKVLIAGKGIGKKQVRVYLGECAELGIREANRLRAEKLREINGQVYTVQSHIPMSEFVVIYNAKHLPTLGAGTQAKYRTHIVNHIIPEFGKWKLSACGTEEIQDWLNRKSKAGLSWWTCNDLRNIISSIFTKAEDWGYWKERNPVERTNAGKKRVKREKKILTAEQTNTLLRELPADVALIVRLADCTGMRISEILGLKWKNVDLGSGWLHVKERYYRGDTDVTKSLEANRPLPLADLIDEMRDHGLRRAINPEAYVFGCPDGTPYDDRNLNQHFLRKAAKRLGLYFPGFGFHVFRRSTVTGIQEDGGSTIEAQKIAGHARPSTTSEYTVMQRQRTEDLVRGRQRRLVVVEKRSA